MIVAIHRHHGAWIPIDPAAQSGRAEDDALSSRCLALLCHNHMGTFLQLQIPKNYLLDKEGSTLSQVLEAPDLLAFGCFNSHAKVFSISAILCIPWISFYKEQAAQVSPILHSGLGPAYVDYSSRLGTVAAPLVPYPRAQKPKSQEFQVGWALFSETHFFFFP